MRDVLPYLASFPGRAAFQSNAIDALVREVSTSDPFTETGGILLGRLELGDYVVSVAGDPGPNAIHKRDFFLRDLVHAQSLAKSAWDDDGSQWIGDWHTHPRGSLMPSDADLRSYRQHLADSDLGFASFLSVIGRSTKQGVAVAAWAVSADSLERVEVVKNIDR